MENSVIFWIAAIQQPLVFEGCKVQLAILPSQQCVFFLCVRARVCLRGLRKWNFQGYLYCSIWKFQGSIRIKNNWNFPATSRGDQKIIGLGILGCCIIARGVLTISQVGFVTLNCNLVVNLKTTHPPLLNVQGSIYFSKDKLVTLQRYCCVYTHQNLNFLEINSFWGTMNYFTHVKTPDK